MSKLARSATAYLLALTLASCDLIDLSVLTLETSLPGANSVLPLGSSIEITFSDAMDNQATEERAKIREFFSDASVPVDYFWESDKVLAVKPTEDLKQGVRYVFEVSGQVRSKDGVDHKVSLLESFYYVHKNGPLQLIAYAPEGNATVDYLDELTLEFDRALDIDFFEDNFSVSPSTEINFAWSNGDRTVEITPKDRWKQFSRHTWTVPDTIKATDGTAILRQYSSSFVVQFDSDPPELLAIESGTYNAGIFNATADLNTVDYKSALRFAFTEGIDSDSFESAMNLSPSVDGTVLQADPATFIFVPGGGWDQETDYVLTLGTDLKDLAGVKLASELRFEFKPAITQLEIDSISWNFPASSSTNTYNGPTENLLQPNTTLDNDITFTIRLSASYEKWQERNRFLSTIQFQAYLPPSSNPTLVNFNWDDNQTLSLVYHDIAVGGLNPWDSQTYKLTIAGGPAGKTDAGQYLPEDVYVLFRAE